MNCDPCPFTSIDFYEGTITEVDPLINLMVKEIDPDSEGIIEVLGEMGLYGNEPHKVVEAVRVKRNIINSVASGREPYSDPQHTKEEVEE